MPWRLVPMQMSFPNRRIVRRSHWRDKGSLSRGLGRRAKRNGWRNQRCRLCEKVTFAEHQRERKIYSADLLLSQVITVPDETKSAASSGKDKDRQGEETGSATEKKSERDEDQGLEDIEKKRESSDVKSDGPSAKTEESEMKGGTGLGQLQQEAPLWVSRGCPGLQEMMYNFLFCPLKVNQQTARRRPNLKKRARLRLMTEVASTAAVACFGPAAVLTASKG